MAKKPASRHHSAARRPQGASKQATLVRAPDASASSVATTETQSAAATMTEAAPKATATATKPVTKPVATKPVATKPVATKPAAVAKPATGRSDASRVARAQATKSARSAHLISASNYAYVLNDLRLTGILAAIMLVAMFGLKLLVFR
jgi:DamX protein